MSPERLLKHFEQISEAPDAVPRLRRFILDLAVRGKLVEQDLSDESAAELLKRIEKEKARLVTAGSIRVPKPMTSIDGTDPLFPIPESWKWISLAEVGSVVGGGTPTSTDPDCFTTGGKGFAWLTPADLGKHSGLYISHGARDLTEKGLSTSSAQLMPAGSVLFTSRAPIGYTAIAENEIATNQGFKSVAPFIPESNRYIATYFKAFATWIDGKASGTTFKEVSGKIVSNLPFPLPPLAEQHRIVAKVDELMVLCDELEAAQAKRERRRDRLVAATLHGMKNGDVGTEPSDRLNFQESARFYFNHLPRLTTRPKHIQKLRQTILNLAVRGMLVKQAAGDEPAYILQERLTAEVKSYASQTGIMSPRPEPVVKGITSWPEPPGWIWTRLSMLCKIITDGDHQPPPKTEDGVAFLTIGNITTGRLDFSNCRFVSEEYYDSLAVYRKPSCGDILYTVVGATFGRPTMVDSDRSFCVQRHIAILKPTSELNVRYLCMLLASPFFYEQATRSITGTAQPTVPLKPLRNFYVPLAPLAEQHRIVARVDELMALCFGMESELSKISKDHRQLLEATLHDALAV